MKEAPSILVFATQHMPTGGIESHLQEFCFHMSASEVKVDLVVLNSAMLPQTEAFFRHCCRTVCLIKHKRSLRRLFRLLLLGVKLGRRRYAALYTNGQGNSILLCSWLFCNRKRWVHHHHSTGDCLDQVTWRKGYWKALHSADKIIACSFRNKDNLIRALGQKIEVIPCFSKKIEIPPPNSSINRQRLRLGYYGRLIPEKGIDTLCLLSEDEDFKGVEFHIWGEGKFYPRSFFEKFSNINYHGSFNGGEELTKVIGSLDALLMLTQHPEGLPISLLEAMSAGLPWLATDQGGIPDIVCDEYATRLIPASSGYLKVKQAVLSFITDMKCGRVTKTSQKELYEKTFSSSALVKRWRNALGFGINS